jgi:hypothetical protein
MTKYEGHKKETKFSQNVCAGNEGNHKKLQIRQLKTQINTCKWQKSTKMELEKNEYDINLIISVNRGISGVLL